MTDRPVILARGARSEFLRIQEILRRESAGGFLLLAAALAAMLCAGSALWLLLGSWQPTLSRAGLLLLLTAELVAGLARWGRVVDSRGTAENGQGDDITRLMLTVDQPDALPAIADYLVTGGARLYALAPQRLPLEELFMRVMREEEPAL